MLDFSCCLLAYGHSHKNKTHRHIPETRQRNRQQKRRQEGGKTLATPGGKRIVATYGTFDMFDVFTVGSDWIGRFDYLKEYCEIVYSPEQRSVQHRNTPMHHLLTDMKLEDLTVKRKGEFL